MYHVPIGEEHVPEIIYIEGLETGHVRHSVARGSVSHTFVRGLKLYIYYLCMYHVPRAYIEVTCTTCLSKRHTTQLRIM